MILQGETYADFMPYMSMADETICPSCDGEIVKINHYEYDGDRGSYEPYHECVECGYCPESEDDEEIL